MPSFVSVWSDRSAPFASTPLDGRTTCDLLVVGGGLLGLSTALHATRVGLKVRVIEARTLGEGASGLSGGQVIPGLKYDPDSLLAHFGEKRGEALIRFAAGTADKVFDTIRDENLDVPHLRNGWIQAAHTGTALAAAAERDRQWRQRGADVSMLDRQEIRALTGTANYLGGWLDRRTGTVHPLALTLELARAAARQGAEISERQRATGLRRDTDGWVAATDRGAEIRARCVLLATNAYSDALLPGLARSIVWLHSFQIATAPLPPALDAAILPGRQAVSDSRRILVYYRKSHDGRFMLGGRGRMSEPRSTADWAHLERAMLRLYPELAGIPVERRWFGRVAMTPDHLPHIHEPEKGLLAVAGCQGRGVGLMTALGEHLAAYVRTGDADVLPLPLSPVRPIPLHGFRRVGVAATIAWYRMRDAFEQ